MGKKEKNASKGATATNKRGSCSSKQSSSRLDLEQPEVDEKYTKTKGKSSSNNNNHRSETKKNKSTKRKNVGSTNHNSNKSDDELRHAIEAGMYRWVWDGVVLCRVTKFVYIYREKAFLGNN